jgi:hypothetical protein
MKSSSEESPREAVPEIMGSPGEWDPQQPGPRGVMAGPGQPWLPTPSTMSSGLHWDRLVGEPPAIMAARQQANNVSVPNIMTSPLAWSMSGPGLRDVMGSAHRAG